jgi:type VI protein secretion system component VasF
MTLIQLTEPLFQYICRINRVARRGTSSKQKSETAFILRPGTSASSGAVSQGASLDYTVVRADIKAIFEDMMAKSATDMRLSQQARKVELPLLFFTDSMISESSLPFAAQWNQNRLAYDRQELAGDEKFFDLLDETLKDNSEDAAERLAVFYTCIGLGFSGIYFKQPEFLRKTMMGIAPRVRHLVENDQNARICPEAYEGVDVRDLIVPPTGRMMILGLVFGGFTLAVLISYIIMYHQASSNINSSIEEVLHQDVAADQSK